MNFGGEGFIAWAPVSQATTASWSPSSPHPDYAPPYGPKAMWLSAFSVPDGYDPKSLTADDVKKQLIHRHGNWWTETVRTIVSESPITGVWATYTVGKLPTLHKDGVVITGDSAHALPPQGGQGVAQAVEDAIALSRLLPHHFEKAIGKAPSARGEAISSALAAYTAVRKPRIDHIVDASRGMSQAHRRKPLLMEWTMYALMAVTTRLGIGPMAQIQDIFAHDVEAEVEKFL